MGTLAAPPRAGGKRVCGRSARAHPGEGTEGHVGTCRPQTKGRSNTVGGSGVGACCWGDEVSYAPDVKLLPSSRPCRPRCEHRAPLSPWSRKVGWGSGQEQVGRGCPTEEEGGLGGRLEALVLSGSQASFLCLRQRSARPGWALCLWSLSQAAFCTPWLGSQIGRASCRERV